MAQDFGKALSSNQAQIVAAALSKAIQLCDRVIGDENLQTNLKQLELVGWRENSSRTAGVRQEFAKIKQVLSGMGAADFGVKKGDYYAEVYPSFAGKMTLADDFWTAADKGADSKAGTLIHEASHWKIVRGTDDHAYGEAIKKLAFTLSRNNADTIEAIAESYDA